MIKKFNEFVNESYSNGYSLNMTAIKGGKMFRENGTFPTMDDAREFMLNWLDSNPGSTIEYFDICLGTNYSDTSSLEVWGGNGGYFANIMDNDDSIKWKQRLTSREMEKIARSEVDIESFLGIE